jgi:hypothetical protein
MRRREFLTLVAALGAGGWPQLLRAEPVNGKIGYLHPVTISPTHSTFSLLQREWRRLGYVDGETVFARSGEGDPHLLPKLVGELIGRGPVFSSSSELMLSAPPQKPPRLSQSWRSTWKPIPFKRDSLAAMHGPAAT